MRKTNFKALAAALFLIFGAGTIEAQVSLEEMYEGLEFEMPRVKETSFPDYSRSITEFGAQAGGIFKNTEAFKKAILEVNSKGGGESIDPPRDLAYRTY